MKADPLSLFSTKGGPILAEGEATSAPRKMFVGWTSFAARQGVDGRALGEEEWTIRTVGADLIITGGRPRGTLYEQYRLQQMAAFRTAAGLAKGKAEIAKEIAKMRIR